MIRLGLLVGLLVGLCSCADDARGPAPICSPWEPKASCVCDGGALGLEVCARNDAGALGLVCRCGM